MAAPQLTDLLAKGKAAFVMTEVQPGVIGPNGPWPPLVEAANKKNLVPNCARIAAAARAVGMSRQSAYRLLARYPGLDEPWRIARETGRARRKVTDLPVQGDSSGRQGDTSARAR